jgi:hypothetical protein
MNTSTLLFFVAASIGDNLVSIRPPRLVEIESPRTFLVAGEEIDSQALVVIPVRVSNSRMFEARAQLNDSLMFGNATCEIGVKNLVANEVLCTAPAQKAGSKIWLAKRTLANGVPIFQQKVQAESTPGRYLEVTLPDPSIPPKKFKSFSDIPPDVAGLPVLLGITSAVPIEIKSKPLTLITFKSGIPTEFEAHKSNLFINGRPCKYLQKSPLGFDSCLTEKVTGPIVLHVGQDKEAANKSNLGLVSQFEEIPVAATRIKFKSESDALNVNTFNIVTQVKNLKTPNKQNIELLSRDRMGEVADSFVSVEFTGNPEILSRNLNQLFLGKYKCKVGYKNIRFGQFICVAPRSKTVVPLWVAPKELLNKSMSESDVLAAQEEAKKLGQLIDVKVVNLKELKIKDAQEYARDK